MHGAGARLLAFLALVARLEFVLLRDHRLKNRLVVVGVRSPQLRPDGFHVGLLLLEEVGAPHVSGATASTLETPLSAGVAAVKVKLLHGLQESRQVGLLYVDGAAGIAVAICSCFRHGARHVCVRRARHLALARAAWQNGLGG